MRHQLRESFRLLIRAKLFRGSLGAPYEFLSAPQFMLGLVMAEFIKRYQRSLKSHDEIMGKLENLLGSPDAILRTIRHN